MERITKDEILQVIEESISIADHLQTEVDIKDMASKIHDLILDRYEHYNEEEE